MPLINISIPYSGIWHAEIAVPSDCLDDVAGYLSENDDLIQDVLEQGWEGERTLDLMDLSIDD